MRFWFIEKYRHLLSDRQKDIFIFVGLSLLIVAVYYPALSVTFLSDDYHMLFITATQESVWRYFFTNLIGERGGHSYGPMFNLFFTLQYWAFGVKSIGFHLASILLHVGNTALVFLLGKQMSKRRIIGLGAGVLYAVFHTHTSALFWISAQPHLIATFFFLLSLFCYVLFARNGWRFYYIVSLFAITISLFTKEIGVTFLFVFAGIDIFFGKKDTWRCVCMRLIRRLFIPACILALYVFMRWYAVGYVSSFYAQTRQQFTSLPYAFRMFIELTVNMFADYPARVLLTTLVLRFAGIVVPAVVIALMLLFLVSRKEWRMFVFLIFSYVFVSLPFLPLAYSPLNNEGERYTYLLSIFFVLFVSFILYYFTSPFSHRRVLYVCCMVVVSLSCMYVTVEKQMPWIRGSRLFDTILMRTSPDIFVSERPILFVGLPDNLDGVPLFRNGMRELLFFKKGVVLRESERVPVYTVLTSDTYMKRHIQIVENNLSVFVVTSTLPTPTHMFIGPPSTTAHSLLFRLRDFKRTTQSGNEIVITTQAPSTVGAQILPTPRLIYFDGSTFAPFDIESVQDRGKI